MRIVIFSGAGMSAESGISTFRASDGLWEKYAIEEVATPDAWRKNADLVTSFYNQRRRQILEAQPNDAHKAIARLETLAAVTVITQNIDDLHERAGSTNVFHLHGNILFAKSSGPNQEKKLYPIHGWELSEKDICDEGFRLRPHVVWFGESVPMCEKAIDILGQADVLIVIGTSLQVYPAAELIHYAQKATRKFIIDPNAQKMNIPNDFQVVNKTATEGMEIIISGLNK